MAHRPTRSTRPRTLARVALLAVAALAAWAAVAASPASAGGKGFIWGVDSLPSWQATVAGDGSWADAATCVQLLPGGVTLVGGMLGNAAGNSDFSLTRYVDGALKWTRRWDGPSHDLDGAMRMALSPDGKAAYLTGVSRRSGQNDWALVKLSTSSGKVQWARTLGGSAHGNDLTTGVGVDAAGNVVVSGDLVGTAHGADAALVSWSPAGKLRWKYLYDGAAHGSDLFYDVVVQADGSAYATGISTAGGMKLAALTVRVSATGTRKWVSNWTGPAGLGGSLMSLTARPGGGVYAAGAVVGTATSTDGAVLQYSPAGKRKVLALDTDGGGATMQVFYDVAVTSTGYVVAGGGTDTGGTADSHLVVYRPNGTVWGVPFTVPGAWSDHFSSVATDAFGGLYAVGTQHFAAGDARIATMRFSTLPGGGGFYNYWAGPVASNSNEPGAAAVLGTSICVVGQSSQVATGADQQVLTYTW